MKNGEARMIVDGEQRLDSPAVLCSPSDLFIRGRPADTGTWCILRHRLRVHKKKRVEIKGGGDGQMEELSEGCSSD